MKTIPLICLLLVAGCSKSKKDYSEVKRVPQTVTADGVTYTVDIPEGLPKDDRDPGDWSDAREEYDAVPKVFTGVYPLEMPKTPEEAQREVALRPKEATFVRTEKRGTGWSVTDANPDKHRVEASSFTQIGDKIVKCTAVQVTDGELPSYDKTKAMLEAICDSVKAK